MDLQLGYQIFMFVAGTLCLIRLLLLQRESNKLDVLITQSKNDLEISQLACREDQLEQLWVVYLLITAIFFALGFISLSNSLN